MTATLEDRLAVSLRTQADRLARPFPGLPDAVIRRGRRIRRRRRVGAWAGVATLGVGIALVAPLQDGWRGLPNQTVATQPSDVATATTDPRRWATGAATAIPYALGSRIIDQGTIHPFHYHALTVMSLYEIGEGTYLTAAAGEDGTTLFLDAARGRVPAVLLDSGIGQPALSPDGDWAAWVAFGGFGSVEAANDRWVVLYDLVARDVRDGPRVSDKDVVAGLRDGRVVLTSAGEAPVREWDPATDRLTDVGVVGQVMDVRDDLALMTVDGCAVAVDAAWSQLWRDCELRVSPGAISPDGDQIVALTSDDRLIFADARTGRRATVISGVEVRPDVWSQRALRWEDGGRVIFIEASAGEPPRVARCTPSAARCEWAGQPPSYDPADQPVRIVLGHRGPDPWRAD